MLLLLLFIAPLLTQDAPSSPQQRSADPGDARHATRTIRDGDGGDDDDDEGERRAPETTITVTARRLDAARARIEPALGAAAYAISNDAIEGRPGGETRTLGSVLLQAPGVARDARGALVVRGEQGALQYRLNGIILPSGAGDFGAALSARLAANTELLTGALPAQYGLAPAGVVNVTTKSGRYLAGGQAELYGGAHSTVEPAAEWSTTSGATGLFVAGSYRRSALGLPAPTASDAPAHDGSRELEAFAYADHVVDAASRVSLIAGSVNERQQIPAAPVGGADGASRFGEVSRHDHYGILAYQRADGPLSLQASIYGLASRRQLRPDEALHVGIDGAALAQRDRGASGGVQVEAAHDIGDQHVVRAGLFATTERLDRDSRRTTPAAVSASALHANRNALSLFVQDEWTLAPTLTANLGVRGDRIGRTDRAVHVQPRASLVWQPLSELTLHAGYARSIASAPLEDSVAQGSAIRLVERSDTLDAGPQWHQGSLTLGLDGYLRRARNLLATRYRTDAPFGDSFSYARARLYGVEVVATYTARSISAWTNLALARATGTGISAGQDLLGPVVVSQVATHRVPLDTDQRLTATAGASLKLDDVLLSGDVAAGSGTPRAVAGGAVNGGRSPAYVTADLALVYHAHLIEGLPTDLRLDLRNAFDRRVALSGGGVGGGAIGWNEPRGIYAGFEQSF